MNPLRISELDNLVAATHALIGAKLQEVHVSKRDILLGFWIGQRLAWLWLDLEPKCPLLLPLNDLPFERPKGNAPIKLFLKAHFIGLTLRHVERPKGLGRIMMLHFSNQGERGTNSATPASLELRLFPHGQNLIAAAHGKHISWATPRDTASTQLKEDEQGGVLRPIDTLVQEWLRARSTGPRKKLDPKAQIEKELQRLNRALEKVQNEIAQKEALPWRSLAQWLQLHQKLQVPKEWQNLVDQRRSLAWNIDTCFRNAKDTQSKIAGTREREQELQQKIQQLQQQLTLPPMALEAVDSSRQVTSQRPSLEGVKARTWEYNSELKLIAGKSAADNLRLLRQARAWDWWLHLKDQPSCHAILMRNKTSRISDEQLREFAQWLIKMNFGAKAKNHHGEKFVIIICECRHVRPIKGDRLGRVNYRQERTFSFRYNPD